MMWTSSRFMPETAPQTVSATAWIWLEPGARLLRVRRLTVAVEGSGARPRADCWPREMMTEASWI